MVSDSKVKELDNEISHFLIAIQNLIGLDDRTLIEINLIHLEKL